jgi:hypothetical protein
VNRSISATALAALFVLTAQAAFADTSSDSAKIAASVLTGTTAAVAAAPTTASVSMPATARVRSAARIPGTFAITGVAPSNQEAVEQQFQLRVMLPALSGNA